MKLLKYGIKRLAFLQTGFIVLVRRIISGSTALALADLVLRFTMTVVKNMVVVVKIVGLVANAIVSLRFGTMYLPSSMEMERAITKN